MRPRQISINRPTPKELAVTTQAAREATWGMKYPPRGPLVLPGWIRVKFYSHIYKIRHDMLPDMEGEVKLHHLGGLDLRKVCQLWNLEDCTPVDPMRWIPVERTDSVWLSPLAVRVLSEQNRCLMFIEPTPLTPVTTHKRELREASIYLQTSLSMFSHLTFSVTLIAVHTCADFIGRGTSKAVQIWDYLDERTKFPMWISYALMVVTVPLSYIVTKTKESFIGKYMQNANDSCRKKTLIVMQSSQAEWLNKQMHWIVLIFCLLMLMVGWLLLLNSLGVDVRYNAIAFLRQPSIWARKLAKGGPVGARAVSMGS